MAGKVPIRKGARVAKVRSAHGPKSPASNKARQPAKEKRGSRRATEEASLRLNLPGETLLVLRTPDLRFMQREAIRWSYSLRNRERWNTQKEALLAQEVEIRKLAGQLGLTPEHLDRIAKAGLVEVSIPWVSEREDWALRIFPWEFLLATATRDLRSERPLTVVRHLGVDRAARRGTPSSWLQVLSAPGALAKEYYFEGETHLIEASVKPLPKRAKDFHTVKDPDEATLRLEVQSRKPDVIHLSGFDSHQGLSILHPDQDAEPRDGYLLRSGVVEAEPLAQILTSAKGKRPALVACNFYNSGSRIAPLCVAEGAAAAIGFQDSFDDELAELFFTTLYQAWSLGGWDLRTAFDFAWGGLARQQRSLQGSAIVLWSERSILEEKKPVPRAVAEEREKEGIRAAWSRYAKETPTPETVRGLLAVEVDAFPRLNYSLLHNDGALFKRFRVRKTKAEVGCVDALAVTVELHVGTDSFPCRLQVAIEETASHIDLPDQIRVSLASSLSRAIHESVHTSLFVEVAWEGIVLFRRTFRVTLLPVDEWRFDTDNYSWLPSFVFPRDPAVLRVIDSAQRYLMALRDDATAGFDGYQSVEEGDPEPADCLAVDLQVRAIWSALLYETPLSYINPPPSFTASSQRLRNPSDCIDGKRGTCIDLALLLASCLEYVEIHPVIVLLRTHAFPAYWRHSSFHERFRLARGAAPPNGERPTSAPGQRIGWDFRVGQYREILGEVQAGRLVPLETTLVTGHGSFADAAALGVQNLANRREFESMLDLLLARTDEKSSVTPLPIRRVEA